MANVKFNISIDENTVNRFKGLFEASGMERPEFAELIVSKGLEAYDKGDREKTLGNVSIFDYYP